MHEVEIEKEIYILTAKTVDILLQPEYQDALTLYLFYYKTAKRQKTNQPKATIPYCQKGLGWGHNKIRKNKKILIDLGLIEDIRRIDKKTKKVSGWYIRLKYLWKKENHPTENGEGGKEKPPYRKSHRVAKSEANALSSDNKNALSSLGSKPNRRKQKFPKEDYEKVLTSYQKLKGLELKGPEFNPVMQEIKTMFMSERTPEDIIGCMEWLASEQEEWMKNWTIKTAKMKIPEYLGKKKKEKKSQQSKLIEIPQYTEEDRKRASEQIEKTKQELKAKGILFR